MKTLDSWMAENGIDDAAYAAELGVKPLAVGRYRRGERIPRRPIMQKIVETTGGEVSPAAFYLTEASHEEAR